MGVKHAYPCTIKDWSPNLSMFHVTRTSSYSQVTKNIVTPGCREISTTKRGQFSTKRDNREKGDVVLLSLCSLTSRPCNLKPSAPLHCNPVCTSSLSLARHKTHKLAPAKNQSINQSVRGSLLIDIQKFNELESRMNSLTAHINNQPSPGSNWYWYIFTDSTVRFRHQKAESRDIRWQIT